jgi:hypothetical protein
VLIIFSVVDRSSTKYTICMVKFSICSGSLVNRWKGVSFIHMVNISILGLPIDYGPYSSLFGTSENLHSPLISFLCCIAKNAYGSKNLLGVRSNSKLGNTTSLVHESGLTFETLVDFSMHFMTHLLMPQLGTSQDYKGSVCMQLLLQCFTSNMVFLIFTADYFCQTKGSLPFTQWDPGER